MSHLLKISIFFKIVEKNLLIIELEIFRESFFETVKNAMLNDKRLKNRF